jgi:hypothetical protein
MSLKNTTLILCKKSHSETWKKFDIERLFDLKNITPINDTEHKDIKQSIVKETYDKYDNFVIEPMSRISEDGDNKLGDIEDLIFFRLWAIDRADLLVTYKYAGYLTAKKQTIRIFQ